MKTPTLIALLALAGLSVTPAWAAHEEHQHGQSAAAAPSPAPQGVADKAAPEDMKAGGKSCKKCKQGKGGGSGGHDHGAAKADGGHDHGAAKAEAAHDHGAGDGEVRDLRARIDQLEKRLDLMQTLLEVLAGRDGKGGRGGQGGHAGHH